VTDLATRVRAGGLIPTDGPTPEKEPLDVVHARAFRHTVLGDRVVVRLTAAALAPGEDAEMNFLGFEAGADLGPVGRQRRRALGFPGWALVNDPERARFALEVVAGLKRALRQAQSKPGNAKIDVDALGDSLSRSVPHFLPSFYEEAGRGFLAAGSTTYAAQYFEKAREAERVHGLRVDEAQRRESILEFALAGAVSIKSLSAYAKDLKLAHEPGEAYAHFRELVVRRTTGGLPPWAGMGKELRALAVAAKLDPHTEELALVREILSAPSLKRAPAAFWKDYRKAVLEVGRASPGLLLELFPQPSQSTEGFHTAWIELLEAAGALDHVEQGRHENAAAWFGKLVAHTQDHWRDDKLPAAVPVLLRRLAPRFIADAKPVKLIGRWESQIDADLTDLALELGVPVADPDKDDSIELERWAENAGQPELGRALEHLAADARFAPLLSAAIESVAGEEDFERAARGKKGLLEARRRWLHGLLAEVSAHGLPHFTERLERLQSATSAATFAEFPEALPVLEACRVAPALARTLQTGFIDELGWPALDVALAELGDERWIGGTWPYLVLANRLRILAVGPEGRVLDLTWSCPPKGELRALHFADGQAMVVYTDDDDDPHGFWTGTPQERFDKGSSWGDPSPSGFALHLEKGGVTEGRRVLRVGDTEHPGSHRLCTDGTTLWRLRWLEGERALFEYDPVTDAEGRRSLPSFFEAFAADGKTLDLGACWLLPLRGLETSPLGVRDGLIGLRARSAVNAEGEAEGDTEYEGIDGRTWRGTTEDTVVALLTLPGATEPRPVVGDRAGRWADPPRLLELDGASVASDTSATYTAGSGYVAPWEYWHFYAARDAAASAALRKISEADVEALLAAAIQDRDAQADDRPSLNAALTARLPLTDARLRRSLVGIVDAAAELDRTLRELTDARKGGEAPHVDDGGFDAEVIIAELGQLDLVESSYGGPFAVHLRAAAAFFAGEVDRREVPGTDLEWWTLPGHLAAACWRAAFTTDDAARDQLLSFFELWASLPFTAHTERLRFFECEGKLDKKLVKPYRDDDETWRAFELAGNRYLVKLGDPEYDGSSEVIEYAPDGVFRDLPGFTVSETKAIAAEPLSAENLRAFVAACRAHGPIRFQRAEAERLAALAGISVAEAALALPGFWFRDRWDQNFLRKEEREALGLKVKEAASARDALLRIDVAARRALLEKAFDPEALFADPVARFAAAWSSQMGQRIAIPDEVMTLAAELLDDDDVNPATLLGAFIAPRDDDPLGTDGHWKMTAHGEPETEAKGAFDGATLHATVKLVATLFAERPVGDPFRAGIPQAVARLQARLANPDLLLGGMRIEPDFPDEDDETAMLKVTRAVLDGLGGEPFELGTAREKVPGRDTGGVVAVCADEYGIDLAVRPAKLVDLDAVRRILGSTDASLWALAYARSPGFAAIAARVAKTPVADGGWETDPRKSAPATVAAVAQARGLDEDAATLYLQTLALPNPSAANVKRWNDWTPARYERAATALVAADLLIVAKRKRAGRNHFLPGGWEALDAPLPPLETWKLSLLGLEVDADGDVETPPLDRLLLPAPLHVLFERAWARIIAGDVPRYREVR
jgi:hypothetical protein